MPRIDLIQIRRGTAAAWTSANPVLASGELGLELDTGKAKFGDGSTAWSSLNYFILTASTLYRSGGTDVPVADGGTGASTIAGAQANLAIPIPLVKSADEAVNNSAVLQNDNHLVRAVAADKVYIAEFVLDYGGPSTSMEMQVAFTGPAGASAVIHSVRPLSTATNTPAALVTGKDSGSGGGTGLGTVMVCGTASSTGGNNRHTTALFRVVLTTAGTAGNLTLQWAQSTAEANDLTVYAGSYCTLQEVV